MIVDLDGKRSLVTRTADGKTQEPEAERKFKSNPTTLAFHDVDQDGLMDLVVLIPYEKVKVLRQVRDRDFEELDVAPPGGAVEQPWLTQRRYRRRWQTGVAVDAEELCPGRGFEARSTNAECNQ